MLRKKLFFSLENRFAECNSQKHSANNNSLPSVFWKNTRQTTFFLRSVKFDTRQTTRQIAVCRHCRCRVLFAECYTRQSLCRVFFGLCRVTVAHEKVTVSGGVRSKDIEWTLDFLNWSPMNFSLNIIGFQFEHHWIPWGQIQISKSKQILSKYIQNNKYLIEFWMKFSTSSAYTC